MHLTITEDDGHLTLGAAEHQETLIEQGFYEDYDLVCVTYGIAYFQLRRDVAPPTKFLAPDGPMPDFR